MCVVLIETESRWLPEFRAIVENNPGTFDQTLMNVTVGDVLDTPLFKVVAAPETGERRIVGFFYYRMFDEPEDGADICIGLSETGNGFGTQILQLAEAELRNNGVQRMVGTILGDPESDHRQLVERFLLTNGFEYDEQNDDFFRDIE